MASTGIMPGQKIALWIVPALLVMLIPEFAYAAGNLTCAGGSVAGGSLFETNPGAGLCQFENAPVLQHLFSHIVCIYAKIMDDVLDTVYCSIQFSIITALKAVVILYIAIFGTQVLTGQTQLAGGEIVMRSVKLCFVWYFATDASYGIGIGFNFFMALINDGIMWVVNAINPAAGVGQGNPMPAYSAIDTLIHQAIIGPFTEANSKVIGFFVACAAAFFPITMMAVWFLTETAMLLISCILIFLLAISAIAFLISLSPLFLSFVLFQSTFYLFENWLRYMISCCMQVIIVFAIVTMWVKIILVFIGFFNDLSNAIFPFNQVMQPANTYQPTDTWAICPHTIGVGAMGPTINCGPAPFNIPHTTAAPNLAVRDNPLLNRQLIPPSRLMEVKQFIYYVVFHLASLILIAFAFRTLLKNANQIARDLVGPAYVPMLGKGFGMEALGTPSSYPKRFHMRSMGGSDRR